MNINKERMKQYRIIRKSKDAFWTIQKRVWWGWKYDSYAVHVKATLAYVDEKLLEGKKCQNSNDM